jgi:hypothetical protein
MLRQEQEQAQANLTRSLGAEAQGDMASLMARYGSQLAISGANARAPLATPPPYGAPGGR